MSRGEVAPSIPAGIIAERRAVALKIPPPCDVTMGFRLLEKGERATTWEWTPDDRFENPAGVIQGGLIAAFLDTVNAATVVRGLADRKATVATVEQKTSFLRPVSSGTRLVGEGQLLSIGGRLAFVESRATNPAGKLVATSTSTWALLPRADPAGCAGAEAAGGSAAGW